MEQESVLGARVVDQCRVDRFRQLQGVPLHPLRVGSRARVLGLESSRESGDRLVVGVFDEMALAALDLEQMSEIARVEEQLLLRLALLRRAERDAVQASCKPLYDREQLQRAERLAEERIGAGLERCFGRAPVGAAQDHDRNVLRRAVTLQLPGDGEPVHPGEIDVEHDRVRSPATDRGNRGRRILRLFDLDVDSVERRSKQSSQSGIVIYEQKTQGHLQPRVYGSLLFGRERGWL